MVWLLKNSYFLLIQFMRLQSNHLVLPKKFFSWVLLHYQCSPKITADGLRFLNCEVCKFFTKLVSMLSKKVLLYQFDGCFLNLKENGFIHVNKSGCFFINIFSIVIFISFIISTIWYLLCFLCCIVIRFFFGLFENGCCHSSFMESYW